MRRGLLASIVFCLTLNGAIAAGAPQVSRVVQSDLAVNLIDFVRVPASDASEPRARINYLFHASDGSGRLFVNDMRGKIYVIRNGRILATPFLNIAAVRKPHFVADGGGNSEVGVITFAFHPDFNRKGMPGYGKFYTLHSEDGMLRDDPRVPVFRGPKVQPDHYNILSEWSVDTGNTDQINPNTRREILRLAAHSDDHGGGQLGFNPGATSPADPDHGLLYISVGDGGNTTWDHGKVEEFHLAQNMMSAFGKILRINPLRSGSRPYSVPGTNPFVGRKDALPEIWASGLRNPQRFSWDNGGARKMLIADIGQASVEEINLGKAGANYGWGIYEGNYLVDHQNELNLSPLQDARMPTGFVFPVAAYGHQDGAAITGGFVYRGTQVPELKDKYVFGDLISGDLFYADARSLEAGSKTPVFKLKLFYQGARATVANGIVKTGRADLRIGMDEDGELYILTKADGAIRKVVRHVN